ncbi:hypothetical protein F2Q68_00011997 [Brassica cretica]|uniref:Uncharacterized protein n=1 Tax=Brassica cretica TaxID=69181 RepID=A0A8S9KVF0_BRACR|nr:hypothetical protein F2Q68_00011997 [Brassica cretica]
MLPRERNGETVLAEKVTTEYIYTVETDGEDDVVADIKGERQSLDLFLVSNAFRFKFRIRQRVSVLGFVLECSEEMEMTSFSCGHLKLYRPGLGI